MPSKQDKTELRNAKVKEEVKKFCDHYGLTNDKPLTVLETFRLICGRKADETLMKLVPVCDRIQERYFDNPFLQTIYLIDQESTCFETNGKSGLYMNDIALDLNLSHIVSDPGAAITLALLVTLHFRELNHASYLSGTSVYLDDEALLIYKAALKDASSKKKFVDSILSCFKKPESGMKATPKDITALIKAVMDFGFGCMFVGDIGYAVNTCFVKNFALDALSGIFLQFSPADITEIVFMAIFGTEPCYIVYETFALMAPDAFDRLQDFFSLCVHNRVELIRNFINEKIGLLANEFISRQLLNEFAEVDRFRFLIKEEIEHQKKWIKSFHHFHNADKSDEVIVNDFDMDFLFKKQ